MHVYTDTEKTALYNMHPCAKAQTAKSAKSIYYRGEEYFNESIIRDYYHSKKICINTRNIFSTYNALFVFRKMVNRASGFLQKKNERDFKVKFVESLQKLCRYSSVQWNFHKVLYTYVVNIAEVIGLRLIKFKISNTLENLK